MKEMTALEAAESLEEMGRIKDMGRPPTDDIERRAAKMIRHMQSLLEGLNQKVEELEKENRYLNDGCAELEALIKSMENDAARLRESVEDYLIAQDELDNREYHGINAEPYDKLIRMRNYARDDLDTAMQANK